MSSAIQIYEIYKVIRRDLSEERAIAKVSALRTTTIEPLAETLVLEAADIALESGLAMADAIIFATASRHKAEIVTGDAVSKLEHWRWPRYLCKLRPNGGGWSLSRTRL